LGLVVAGFRAAVFLPEGFFFEAFFELVETRLIEPVAAARFTVVRFFVAALRFAGFT